jgi:hypothetical protein
MKNRTSAETSALGATAVILALLLACAGRSAAQPPCATVTGCLLVGGVGLADIAGDDPASAGEIRLTRNGFKRQPGHIDYPGDVDYYEVTAASPLPMMVVLHPAGGRGHRLNGRVTVYDGVGSEIPSENVIHSDRLHLTKAPVEGDPYCVAVEGVDGSTGNYVLDVQCTVDDHGDSIDDASRMRWNGNVFARIGNLDYDGDVDFFSVTPRRGGYLWFSLRAVGRDNPIAPMVTVYDGSGQVLASETAGAGDRVVRLAVEEQALSTCYVAVCDADDQAMGKYVVAAWVGRRGPGSPGGGGDGGDNGGGDDGGGDDNGGGDNGGGDNGGGDNGGGDNGGGDNGGGDNGGGDTGFMATIEDVDNSDALTGYVTRDIVLTTDTDWLSSQLVVTLTSGTLYQDAAGGIGSPNPALFALAPSLEFDTYVSNGVVGQSVAVISAADLAPGAPVQCDANGIALGWFSVMSNDIGSLPLARITLSDDAVGTFHFLASALTRPAPLEMTGTISGGVMTAD